MHKKLAADLTSLAHSILQMKNKEDVFALQKKAHQVYEKLSILAYVEEYINNTPNPEHTKEELLDKIAQIASQAEKEEPLVRDIVEEEASIEEVVEKNEKEDEFETHLQEGVSFNETEGVELQSEISEMIEATEGTEENPTLFVEDEAKEVTELINEDLFAANLEGDSEEGVKNSSLDEELKDTMAADVVANLFETATKKSLNDKLHGDIQIGLNDRIAFVKNLFNGSQEDFNRVISQLNTLKTEKEAKKFINKMVKPDYDWTDKEDFEERFVNIVVRKFA